MKGYKAFYRWKGKLRCKDKIYEVGKTYTEPFAVLCTNGMHFCKLLIDCFMYYHAPHAVICEVEAPDDKCVGGGLRRFVDFIDDDSKVCTKELTITREVPFSEWTRITESEAKKFEALGHPWRIASGSTRMDILRTITYTGLLSEVSYRILELCWRMEGEK